MKPTTNRRQLLLIGSAAFAATTVGCGPSAETKPIVEAVDDAAADVQDAIRKTDTQDLKRYKLALRGYQIVSFAIASRVVFLPYPGMRIVSVAIVATSVAAKLAVEYIDDELIQRRIEELISDSERSA
ncbi:MAG: hypothetical protein AAF745_17625, partial [Planctomycetota bacterium]